MKKIFTSIINRFTAPSSLVQLKDSDYIAYNESRKIKNKKFICHAPFNNLYFNTEGHIAVCWLTFNNPVIYSEDKSLFDIWNDVKLRSLREHVKANDLQFQCNTCHKHIKEGNHINVLSRAYDNNYPLGSFPSIMEFELDNTCNLACTMCNGMLSSSIRKDREKLPPLISPYGAKFLKELREFIPYLKEARFNGGEPFLIKKYFDIWEMIFELNPSVKITIATNGTVLNNKVKSFLDKGNFHLNISMDGFTKETYEQTRINGDFNKLMVNFEWFRDYCHTNNRTLCIMINPMRQNWWEMPDFVNWCNNNKVHLWFNSIMHPEDQALWNLPDKELEKIYHQLSDALILENKDTPQDLYDYNVNTFKNLVEQQIKTWWVEAKKQSNQVFENKLSWENLMPLLTPLIKNKVSFNKSIKGLNKEELDLLALSTNNLKLEEIAALINSKSTAELKQDIKTWILRTKR